MVVRARGGGRVDVLLGEAAVAVAVRRGRVGVSAAARGGVRRRRREAGARESLDEKRDLIAVWVWLREWRRMRRRGGEVRGEFEFFSGACRCGG